MSTNEQLAERPTSVKAYLELPQYKARFGEVLGARAPQFMAALVALASQEHLAKCEPRSVIAAAMVAATLDLPIEKSLGFAHVVGYAGQAQFQMAAKGYIQLALRSGQYQRLNAKAVNAEVVGEFDEVGEPKIDWSRLDETKPVVGYVVAWKLVNGFVKVAYWSKEKVEHHAATFSQAYKKKKLDSPWFTNFDKMALKTVMMNELRAYGPLSVQLQTALVHDQGAQRDIDTEVEFVDREPPPERPVAPAREKKGAATVKENKKPDPKIVEGEFTEPGEQKTPAAAVESELTDDPKKAAAAEAQPTPPPVAPETKVARAFLKPNEEIEAICTVVEVTPTMLDLDRVNAPSVQVTLKGDFSGVALHHKGGTGDSNAVAPLPIWTVGNTVKVKLFGRQFKGGVRTMVLGVEAVAAQKGMVLE